LKYAGEILRCTESKDSILNIREAKQRSPFFLPAPVSQRKYSALKIYCGIHDGYTGSVPITQSIYFYNNLVGEMGGPEYAMVPEKDISTMLAKRTYEPLIEKPASFLGDRLIHYRRSFQSIQLCIFEGGHEMLPGPAIEEIDGMINHLP
jgi:hypothetical protein